MIITTFGSCRQQSIKNHFNVTSIQERLTYPHYTKEIIQAIEYCKGIHTFDNALTRYCFRTGILEQRVIDYQSQLQQEFESSNVIVVEIASRICYTWNGVYVHHILTEPKYGFHDIPSIAIRDLTDEEIEQDILRMKELVYPKKLLIATHLCTRNSGRRFDLVQLLEAVTYKYNIPCINPSQLLEGETNIYEDPIAFHYTPKGHHLIRYQYKYFIDQLFYKKNAVVVWKYDYYNCPRTLHDNFWGFGDMLRGIIGVYKLCKQYQTRLIVDSSLHPVSRFFKNQPHIFSSIVSPLQDSIPCLHTEHVKSIFDRIPDGGTFMFFSCMGLDAYNDAISNDLKLFIKRILTPTDEFTRYIEERMKPFINTNYSILHYRIGDDDLILSSACINYEPIYQHLLSQYKHGDVVISDSSRFKDYIKTKNPEIQQLNTEVCHVGYTSDYNALRDTLFEFLFMTKSSRIKSFTRYDWVSGFVQIIHKIFDVPLEAHINFRYQ